MLGVTATLCACAATGNGSNNGQSATNNQASGQANGAAQPLPEPGLTPRKRILKAIQQLEQGNSQVAKVELEEYLISTPDSQRAKHLLKQIVTPASEFYPAEFFTVKLAFGQSISNLTQHYLGNALEFYALAKYNGIENPSRINTGSKIKVPLTAYAKSVREKDSQQAAQKEQQGNTPESESVAVPAPEAISAETVEAQSGAGSLSIPEEPETPEVLQARLAEANQSGDFALSVSLLASLNSLDVEFDDNVLQLAMQALDGRANAIADDEPATAASMYLQAGDLMQQNGDDISAFDHYKLAADTDPANASAQQKMMQTQQQIVDKYHREASIAFRQQRIEEAIDKWDLVLHVDPSNTNVSAYRTQALELQQRLKAIK